MASETSQEIVDDHILRTKAFRKEIQETIDDVRKLPLGMSRETNLAVTQLQQARHWLGEELGRLHDQGHGKEAYPNGNDPTTTQIDPPADK